MSDVSGIPNLGFGGGANFASMSNSAMNAQPNYSAQANNNLNYVASQQPSQAQLYGGGSFGAQPAYYAGVGAAYGRATGGFNGGPGPSVFDTGTTPYNSYGISGSGMGSVAAPAGPSYGSPSTDYNTFQGAGASGDFFRGLNPQQQDYYQQHVNKYGYAPTADNSALQSLGGGGGGTPMSYSGTGGGYGGGIAAINAAAGPGAGLGGGGAAASYAQQHMARYGYMPDSSNATYAALLAQDGGGGGGGGGGGAPKISPWGQAGDYAQQHFARYGYMPDSSNATYTGLQAADRAQPLFAQREAWGNALRDDPSRSLQLAARLYSEDQNNPATRQGILEAMLNRYNATGRDPLDAAYYPKNQDAYNNAYAKLSNDNALLGQVYDEMHGAFGGSNLSNYATDWASPPTSVEERKYATPTWTSPSNEEFFRKDINNTQTGAGIAAKNQNWYNYTRR